jgi:hypothetical protein
MKILKNYLEFVNETNLMTAVSRGSNIEHIDFEKHEPDAFINQEETLKKCSVPGKDKEGKTIHNIIGTEKDPITPMRTQISTY